MEENVSLKDMIKIETDIDDDDYDGFLVYNVLDAAEGILDKNDDPLLSLTPLVYTTKLDDMKTIKQDLTNLNANQILKKLHSESTPIIRTESIKHSSKSDNVKSFEKLASVINDINYKATCQLPPNTVISPNKAIHQISSNFVIPPKKTNTQLFLNADDPSRSDTGFKTTERSKYVGPFSHNSSVASDIMIKTEPQVSANAAIVPCSDRAPGANTAADKEYRPCYVVLQDIKILMPTNQTTVKLPLRSNMSKKSGTVDPHGSKIFEVKVKVEQVENETSVVEIDMEVSSSSETRISHIQDTTHILKPVLESKVRTYSQNHVLTDEINLSPKDSQKQKTETGEIPAENLDTKDRVAKITSPVRSRRKTKSRICFETSSDEDYGASSGEDYEPIINLKKKTKTNKIVSNSVAKTVPNKVSNSNNVSNIASVTIVTNDSAQTAFQEKYALIVLTHKKKITFVYRVNAIKLVTDYYITNNCDEYKLASMYPKEEKVVEQYCCWYKREEMIARICSRKNYPFTILKFLKQPHTCHPEECLCCCRISQADTGQRQKERRAVIYRSRKRLAENRIRELLCKTNPDDDGSTTTGLVSKALTYIPNTPKVINEKVLEKQCDKYLENYLLCLRNMNDTPNRVFNAEYELYEIGQNGNVLRSLLLYNKEEIVSVRRTYLMSMQIRDAELCCWYKREKLMQELKTLKTSPATLKQIRKPHSCQQKCSCCCKPLTVKMRVVETLPSTFKQTTGYEKNLRRLTINFSAKSKNAMLKEKENYNKSKETTKSTDASTAAVVLSGCASKDDNPDLSVSILSKFKNLKLDINTCGELEAVLNEPAKNLPVAELKILSDILALSKKQIVELGLSAEEFCNRINSKSSDIIRTRMISLDSCPETSLIRTEEFATPPLQDLYEDSGLMDVKVEDMDVENDPIIILTNQTMYTGETQITSPKLLSESTTIEPPTKTTSPSLKINNAKSISTTYTLLSNFMEKKNKNFVDSFKSFFNGSEPSNLVIPKFNKFTPMSISAGGFECTATEEEPLPLPIIEETFTLATERPTIAIPGPSGITRLRETKTTAIVQADIQGSNSLNVYNNQIQTLTSSPNTYKRKMENVITAQVEKKIRVKPPSELNAPNLQTSPITAYSQPISAWPDPIVIKQEPQTNIQQIVRPVITAAKTISPYVQNQTYVVTNNVVASNLKVVSPINVNKVIQLSGHSIQMNNSKTGLRYLTLAPILSKSVDASKNTKLDKIMKAPQAPPAATSSAICHVPPLVPIRSPGAAPVTVIKEKRSSNETEDLENSITCYSLIQHKK